MGGPRRTTQDRFEAHFGTNHLGHFALTGLLADRLLATPGSRVVTVSSLAHDIRARINFEDLQSERSYTWAAAYGQSKLANLMYVRAATPPHRAWRHHDRRRRPLPTLRGHRPGVLGGQYYGPDRLGERRGHPRLVTSSPQSYDLTIQQRLWTASEKLTGAKFPL